MDDRMEIASEQMQAVIISMGTWPDAEIKATIEKMGCSSLEDMVAETAIAYADALAAKLAESKQEEIDGARCERCRFNCAEGIKTKSCGWFQPKESTP